MRILYIANTDSIHTQKWISYFSNKYPYDIYNYLGDSRNFTRIPEMKSFIKEKHIDIVHAHYAGWNGLFGALCNHHPFVVTTWGSDVILNSKQVIKRGILKYILNKADLITTDATHMISAIKTLGINNTKIKRINFGVDVDLFKPNPVLHIRPTIISLRSLEPIYDVETLIKAIPEVITGLPNSLFIIVGEGSQKSYLESLVKELNILNNVIFYGKVAYTEIPKLLNSSDLYVSTSLSDAGLASSTAEAMSCGLPVLITDVYDNKEWISNTFDCGDLFMFKPKDYKSLANMILMVLKVLPGMGFGEENHRTIVERNNYTIEMDKMDKLYGGLL